MLRAARSENTKATRGTRRGAILSAQDQTNFTFILQQTCNNLISTFPKITRKTHESNRKSTENPCQIHEKQRIPAFHQQVGSLILPIPPVYCSVCSSSSFSTALSGISGNLKWGGYALLTPSSSSLCASVSTTTSQPCVFIFANIPASPSSVVSSLSARDAS